MSKIKNLQNNLETAAAANDIQMKQHLKDVKLQNDSFNRLHDQKIKELDEMNQDSYPNEHIALLNEISEIATAIKMNENTIKELELS